MVIIVMGVSGSGKTTVGKKLADAMGCPFYDADDYLSPASKEKLRQGIPLTDVDRRPWLERLADEMKKWEKGNSRTVLVCSALKQKYRDLLSGNIAIQWLYLKGDRETIRKRLENRSGHFASPSILESQFADLEEPTNAIVVDIRKGLNEILESLIRQM